MLSHPPGSRPLLLCAERTRAAALPGHGSAWRPEKCKKKVFLGSLKTTAGHEAVGSGSKARELQGWDRLGDGTAFHARMLSAPRGREKEEKKQQQKRKDLGSQPQRCLKQAWKPHSHLHHHLLHVQTNNADQLNGKARNNSSWIKAGRAGQKTTWRLSWGLKMGLRDVGMPGSSGDGVSHVLPWFLLDPRAFLSFFLVV